MHVTLEKNSNRSALIRGGFPIFVDRVGRCVAGGIFVFEALPPPRPPPSRTIQAIGRSHEEIGR
jgi:hypothetical protein